MDVFTHELSHFLWTSQLMSMFSCIKRRPNLCSLERVAKQDVEAQVKPLPNVIIMARHEHEYVIVNDVCSCSNIQQQHRILVDHGRNSQKGSTSQAAPSSSVNEHVHVIGATAMRLDAIGAFFWMMWPFLRPNLVEQT